MADSAVMTDSADASLVIGAGGRIDVGLDGSSSGNSISASMTCFIKAP